MLTPLVHAEANPASPSAFPIKLPSLFSTLGALLIATFIGLILLGIIFHQAYRYARIFPKDSPWIKGLVRAGPSSHESVAYSHPEQVALVVFLEIVSSGLAMHMCYYYLVTNYFNPQNLGVSVWSANVHALAAGATMATSQRFSTKELLNTASVHLNPTGFCLAMAADLMLTVSLIHTLRRKRTGFKGTDNIIDTLVMYSVNTGLLNGYRSTIIVYPYALLTVCTPHCQRLRSPYHNILYAITLLAALHSRSTFRLQWSSEPLQDGDIVFGMSYPSELATATPHSGSNATPSLQRGQMNIHQIQRSTRTINGEDVVELKVIAPILP
ncbi:hypothetical protein VTO73DRAFT_10291 [Trametes versicolor]